MNKIELLKGTLIGFLSTFIGVFLFFELFTNYSFGAGITQMKSLGFLGKIITLGAILNMVAFFGLLKLNKELMARGVVLATILLAIFTLFV
ncbi:hypothetical protein B0A78_07330 [Flavobacterium columnare NBRC 100251 = ATCC 23463]|uniref:Uncharacterized protein n=2 Tax=Flavobacterium columnare TaxID=996 RepID=G8X6U9_FLACA|nr:hypothetical protein [Flavobacterium columnare]AEW85684.1 hypothetical protein FCOL_04250 [Flavobacterium columnare ATCC 49512]AMO20855.1 hypothetical protein UN65_11415 [Flavobacterium columnare]ANO47381.1 hypothetical protein Pf1_01926 [Flavobacterium columnare]APT21966.1 hypothetical protein BU993_04510 [Flavobacterium columnare]AUX18846.1 hypothetical protein AQ623_11625 [Flavobacterium columnare]